MSAVITTLSGPHCLAIQSSAASKLSDHHARTRGDQARAALVAHDGHRNGMAKGDLVDLLLDRAGIGIDQNGERCRMVADRACSFAWTRVGPRMRREACRV
jgi:hypothetical protein